MALTANEEKLQGQVEILEKLNFVGKNKFLSGEHIVMSTVILEHEALGVEVIVSIPQGDCECVGECSGLCTDGRVMFLNINHQHIGDVSRVEELCMFANYKF